MTTSPPVLPAPPSKPIFADVATKRIAPKRDHGENFHTLLQRQSGVKTKPQDTDSRGDTEERAPFLPPTHAPPDPNTAAAFSQIGMLGRRAATQLTSEINAHAVQSVDQIERAAPDSDPTPNSIVGEAFPNLTPIDASMAQHVILRTAFSAPYFVRQAPAIHTPSQQQQPPGRLEKIELVGARARAAAPVLTRSRQPQNAATTFVSIQSADAGVRVNVGSSGLFGDARTKMRRAILALLSSNGFKIAAISVNGDLGDEPVEN